MQNYSRMTSKRRYYQKNKKDCDERVREWRWRNKIIEREILDDLLLFPNTRYVKFLKYKGVI